ncbi:hypothetical protein ACQB6R_06720 [Propionibacteriaceae bacterium G1746]
MMTRRDLALMLAPLVVGGALAATGTTHVTLTTDTAPGSAKDTAAPAKPTQPGQDPQSTNL